MPKLSSSPSSLLERSPSGIMMGKGKILKEVQQWLSSSALRKTCCEGELELYSASFLQLAGTVAFMPEIPPAGGIIFV